MQGDDVLLRLMLAGATFLTTKEKTVLQNNLDGSASFALYSIEDISRLVRRVIRRATWNGAERLAQAQREARVLDALGIRWTAWDSADFPALLREMADPPYLLFYRGNVDCLKNPCVSVVGTRRATVSARKATETFARDAADDGCTVVSGLAYGIDGHAHKGCLLSARGQTAAVLPCGIDTITPSAHKKLAQRLLEKGGVLLSEYAPGTGAQAFRFVQRNRIIAALSSATVVMQAPAGSGALITAEFALEYGRDVLLHAECFSDDARLVEQEAIRQLRMQAARGKNVAHKLAQSVQRYRDDGAPVIAGYADYQSCRADAPGCGNRDDRQSTLF